MFEHSKSIVKLIYYGTVNLLWTHVNDDMVLIGKN